MSSLKANNVTAVLVHAAWADGSSWNKVTSELQRQGLKVVAAQIPMTSLTDDVTALRRVLRSQDGPVVLAGHSYGGAVIAAAAAGDPKVKALVYVAAIVPDEGETVGQIFGRGLLLGTDSKTERFHPASLTDLSTENFVSLSNRKPWLLSRSHSRIDGAFRSWGFARGGTGAISNAIADAAREAGAEIQPVYGRT